MNNSYSELKADIKIATTTNFFGAESEVNDMLKYYPNNLLMVVSGIQTRDFWMTPKFCMYSGLT